MPLCLQALIRGTLIAALIEKLSLFFHYLVRFVPIDIQSQSSDSLTEKGVPKAIIRRLLTKKILWMVRLDPAHIANLHR